MISWESILSVFNTKGTLLKWLQKLEKALKDGVLLSVTVNTVSEGVITLTLNFADGSTITTPQINLPEGERGPQGVPGADGADGTDGTDGRDALVQNRALSSANITSPMAIPIEALNRTAVVGEPIVMFATDTTENKTYMLIGTVTNVGSPSTNPYVFVTYSSKVDITGMTGPQGPQGDPGAIYKHYITDGLDNKITIFTNSGEAMTEWNFGGETTILSFGKSLVSGNDGVLLYLDETDTTAPSCVFVTTNGTVSSESLGEVLSDDVTKV